MREDTLHTTKLIFLYAKSNINFYNERPCAICFIDKKQIFRRVNYVQLSIANYIVRFNAFLEKERF